MKSLSNIRVAMLVTDGFEQSEMVEPKKALEEAGIKVDLISPKSDKVKGWTHGNWGDTFSVDVSLEKADPSHYQFLVLPGGVMNPDSLRLKPEAIQFIQQFVKDNKPIAAICHGPWTLINAGAVKGKTITSWPTLKVDLENAGATWVDREVVRDGNLITSRKPQDLKAFNEEILNYMQNL